MLEVVEVIDVNGDEATVFLTRHTACGDCGKCMVAKQNLDLKATVKNTLNASVGDKVTVEMELKSLFGASLIMYGFPLLMFIAGMLLGFNLLAPAMNADPNVCAFLLGLAFIAAAYGIVKIFDRRGVFRERYELTMKGIVG